uniref:Protein kinase domain-containing protein n=1 Tax=Chlamydomonas leiostraca TaxID=1034604 RepID=A0A7S0S6G9_9CHLO|mmetsp:Transcript_9842/g.24553  ORF Transcript_9842/g.24553 Transcript_9842/m.24553 type:complete len:1290 (+) Transcript_9842:213-4082(+)|eukprot:CAMPEP_0202882900 /NCGR_PEP_ID=MMETSP1391-20130828/38642_1 /ASSEMBLY_ACC=CAM_ASM_000867 /TAXON_ID=1034604 /ORGANISM="Chlamydomonas leiostraca, Strain SAG 11-49" /LENGTH=1289 /DNA_ID=CAMNT_0049565829 /DNA_START=124 /DNA_END=3993 /DNA_ORIENTATION=-
MQSYHIYEKIGKGKYSTVYKGRRKKTIQYYAIKSVDKSQKARVLQEVRTMHALDHKNILKFFAWYETTNHLWLILEYCVGGDLNTLLRQDVRLPESSVHDFGRDLVVALQYLHHNSIIYCDLKPSNILLDENGRLKLGGFGLSRRLADINKTPVQSLPQAKRGTPCYMAPELYNDGAAHSSASDLWALGCVLYEAAMGRPPFLNSSFNQLVQEILNKEPAPIPGASPEFSDLIMRLLDKNPATRIGWRELVNHPFWQAKLQWLEIPPEPALEAFIRQYNLAPFGTDPRASMIASQSAAKTLRQSVDVTRLSRIALSNLEKEGDGSDYAAAEGQVGDIRIDNADAELDFDEQKEDADDEEPPSPAQSDDGAMIDQGDAGRLGPIGGMNVDNMRAQARGRAEAAPARAHPTRSGDDEPSTSGRDGDGADYPGEDDMETGIKVTDGQALEGLIWHSSDSAVKPIVANRRIERLPEPRYEAKSLPFTPLSLTDMLHAEQKDLENFLTHIYRAIASAAPLKDKVNVLSYFETLCVDTNAANVLINSSLTILFIRMLRNARAPTLRIRLASVLGLLVRHATYIAEELAQTSVIEILTEALKDKNERVRRRVMATLGELLFYIATQQQDAQSGVTAQEVSDCWSINSATISAVTRLLKPQEDEIAQHYAVKTIENICSQGGDWAAKFCSQDVAFSLVQIYTSTKSENLKSTTASTLGRLLRHSPMLVAYVVDKFGIRLFVQGLQDPSSKVQVAAVNMLNMALSQPDLTVRAKAALSEERSLVPNLMSLLDHSLPLLRSKGVVAILLLCRLSTRWLLETCKVKLIPVVERLQREKDECLQEAIGALRAEMSRLVPAICQQINDELAKVGARKATSLASPGRASASKNPLQQFQVVLHVITSPYFRSSAVTPALLGDLASYLTVSETPQAGSLNGMQEFRTTLMHVLEAICQQTELVLLHHQAMLDHMLPALCEVVGSNSENGDLRFFCLRMVSEVLQLFLMDGELYGVPGAPTADQQTGIATAAIDALLTQSVLPLIPRLLRDDDPMPLYALKLLGGLLEVKPAYVQSVEAMGLASQFFEFLSLEHSNNNVHNIRLCRQIIAAGTMPVPHLVQMQVAEKVAAVLEYAAANNVEPFLEPALELCHAIIARDSKEVEAGRSDGSLMATLLDKAGLFLELCGQPDVPVSCAAALCLTAMVSVYTEQCAPWLLAPESLGVLVAVLQGEHLEGGGAVVAPALQQYLLEAVATSLAVEGAAAMSSELVKLASAVKHLTTSPDPSVQGLAVEVSRTLDAAVAAG